VSGNPKKKTSPTKNSLKFLRFSQQNMASKNKVKRQKKLMEKTLKFLIGCAGKTWKFRQRITPFSKKK
jgi:hypothetical protein